MNSNFKKISSVFLALLVTISTFSFTIEKHFCGDILVDVSYVGESEGCCEKSASLTIKKKDCCDDEVVHIEGQDELQKVVAEKFQFSTADFFTANPHQKLELSALYSQKTFLSSAYSPPEIILEIHILQEVFII